MALRDLPPGTRAPHPAEAGSPSKPLAANDAEAREAVHASAIAELKAELAKLKQVNDWLRDNCERAWDIEPDATLDESRLRLHSRFCSFVTQMICKPIKEGCTIYCVNFSKSSYLYTWEWYNGTTEGERPQGQRLILQLESCLEKDTG